MTITIERFAYLDGAALFSAVADQEWSIYLDSGVIGTSESMTKHADFDVLAIKPMVTLVASQTSTYVTRAADQAVKTGDPLAILQAELAELGLSDATISLSPGQPEPAYLPGAFGYVAYDLARRYEELPELAENEEQLPEMAMGLYSCIVLIDHQKQETLLIYLDNAPEVTVLAAQWRCLIELEITTSAAEQSIDDDSTRYWNRLVSVGITENMSREAYNEHFARVRQYTLSGDCYQVNLSKQFATRVTGDCWQTYQYLRCMSPAPYGAYMNLPFAQILSNSPESFLQCRNNEVVTSPIKGTRARDHTNTERDRAIRRELYDSAKDRAENLMIVDLMRNDLSTSCELGSVTVPALFAVHSFANVHHLISTITGQLRQGLHSIDLFRKCFPGGSITGAPKIRAMEIIEELEPNRRGLYCGSVAYFGANGDMETNIAIRTIVVKDGIARYCAGGGLVIDSDVEEEYQELIDKASMMTEALFT